MAMEKIQAKKKEGITIFLLFGINFIILCPL